MLLSSVSSFLLFFPLFSYNCFPNHYHIYSHPLLLPLLLPPLPPLIPSFFSLFISSLSFLFLVLSSLSPPFLPSFFSSFVFLSLHFRPTRRSAYQFLSLFLLPLLLSFFSSPTPLPSSRLLDPEGAAHTKIIFSFSLLFSFVFSPLPRLFSDPVAWCVSVSLKFSFSPLSPSYFLQFFSSFLVLLPFLLLLSFFLLFLFIIF